MSKYQLYREIHGSSGSRGNDLENYFIHEQTTLNCVIWGKMSRSCSHLVLQWSKFSWAWRNPLSCHTWSYDLERYLEYFKMPRPFFFFFLSALNLKRKTYKRLFIWELIFRPEIYPTLIFLQSNCPSPASPETSLAPEKIQIDKELCKDFGNVF